VSIEPSWNLNLLCRFYSQWSDKVSIEPSWNLNKSLHFIYLRQPFVSIEPSWNLNFPGSQIEFSRICEYWTIVEFKPFFGLLFLRWEVCEYWTIVEFKPFSPPLGKTRAQMVSIEPSWNLNFLFDKGALIGELLVSIEPSWNLNCFCIVQTTFYWYCEYWTIVEFKLVWGF